jgi:hypothetical protein
MSEESRGTTDRDAYQRHVASLVLGEIGTAGFALAGSGAIREHGITDRPTNDVDLFTTTATGPDAFAAAVAAGEQVLRDHGYQVTQARSTAQFARLLVEAVSGPERSLVVEIDLGIDWRAEPPAQFAIGPVLAVSDAVGSKVAAVYSRGEARDFLDLDAIRQSGRFTDAQLLALANDHDPGFERATFARQLRRVLDLGPVETAEYGSNADHLEQIQRRLGTWADELLQPPAQQSPPPIPPAPHPPERRPDPPANRDPGPRGPSL